MRYDLLFLCLLPLCLLLTSSVVTADTISLINGDLITGTIRSLQGERLSVETEYAGTINIDLQHVAAFTTEQPMLVEFESGQRIEAQVILKGDAVEIVGAENLTAGRSQLVSMRPPLDAGGDPGVLDNWDGNVDAGYSITRGNTELNNLSFTFEPTRRTNADRIRARFQSLKSVQDGITNSSLYRGRIRYDRYLNPGTFLFFTAEAENDIQQQLNLRTREGAGVGLQFEAGSQTVLSIFGGVTFLQEKFVNLDRTLNAEGLAGFELETRLFGPVLFETKTQVLPLLTEKRYLAELDASLRFPFFQGLTFGIQFFDKYDSRPVAGVRHNDLGLLSTIGYRF